MREKVIGASLVIERRRKGEEHTSRYEARVTLSEQTTVGELAEFVEAMQKIWEKAMQVRRNPEGVSDVFTEIYEAVYEREEGGPLETVSFDRWSSHEIDDISIERGEEGIYLRPDTKYTPAERDMFIGRDILRDMACAMR